jgi:hypothetical protein
MWLTKLFAALMAILAGFVPSSCTSSKNPTAQQQHAPVVIIATSSESLTNKNLGELQLTNHYETCINLGAGKSCTIRPTLIDHASLRLTMSLESKNSSGGVKGLSVVQIVTKTGQPFEVAVGDMSLTLTPVLAAE